MSINTNIAVKYMGLSLPSPIIASSSDFTSTPDSIEKLANAGVGAVVLKSLFEEQILMEIDSMRVNNMFGTYSYNEDYIAFYTRQHEVRNYLSLISDAKKRVSIPVIASINCSTASEWMSFTAEVEKAGADAIELNIFAMPSNPTQSESEIRQLYHNVVDGVRKNTKLPLAVKLHYYFTDMAAFMVELSEKVDSLVLFNRFFNPDIDLKNLKVVSAGSLSSPTDFSQVMRWIGVLSGKVKSQLSASGGIHDGNAVLKSILSGADVVQIASVLYKHDIDIVKSMLTDMQLWMQENGYESLDGFRGLLSQKNIAMPNLYERAQFMKYFSDFNQSGT